VWVIWNFFGLVLTPERLFCSRSNSSEDSDEDGVIPSTCLPFRLAHAKNSRMGRKTTTVKKMSESLERVAKH